MSNLGRLLLLLFAIFLFFPSIGQAEQNLHTRQDVLEFLKKANDAQVSLSAFERTEEEIDEVLTPYFTDSYNQLFKEENVIKTVTGKWITYGTDFALYYIPYFQFTDKTQIVLRDKDIYVYEHFPEENQGPVTYKDHYEAIMIKKFDSGWKIAEYSLDFNPQIIKNEQSNHKSSIWKTLLILPLEKLLPIIYRFH